MVCSNRQEKNNNKVKLTVTYDMGWQKRSSGRRYDSSSGHAFGFPSAVHQALQEEIKDTLGHNNQSYGEWCAQTDKEKNNNKFKLTVTYDMGWQKRSSSRRYDFSSRHTFIIGARSKGIIGMVLY